MELKTIGYYKEMPHGQISDPSIKDHINKEDPSLVDNICQYLYQGTPLIVSPGKTTDVINPENGFSGTATAYTDGEWVWPGDLAYYVEKYLLHVPEEFLNSMSTNNWLNPIKDKDLSKESIILNGIRFN